MNNHITYLTKFEDTVVDSGKIIINKKHIQDLYYLSVPMKQHKRGYYEIELFFRNETRKAFFYYGIKGELFWTNDLDELVGVMKYILPTASITIL